MKIFEEMLQMTEQDLFDHLFTFDKLEIANMLDENGIPYKYYHGKRKLCEEAARHISGLGVFKRIAGLE